MSFTRLVHQVQRVGFGERTHFGDGALTVSTDDALQLLHDPALRDLRLSWVSPNESARIVKILDAIEPRTKGPGGGGIFPGFLGPARLQGNG
ncbi:MAG: glycine/sarcosine/betaine reductase component B subunit, partial [Actinomycetota bacterium]|nr:glycine/sarcosine/betaine reductase component B subunit [Actinomycetota bacterium]